LTRPLDAKSDSLGKLITMRHEKGRDAQPLVQRKRTPITHRPERDIFQAH